MYIYTLIILLISHVVMGIFWLKPKYNWWITACAWGLYGIVFFLLGYFFQSELGWIFLITLMLHIVMFILSTKGKFWEKIFLFFGYSCIIFICRGVTLICDSFCDPPIIVKILIDVLLIGSNQVLFQVFILPKFRKACEYSIKGMGKICSTVFAFFVVFMFMSIYPNILKNPGVYEISIFFMMVGIFYVSYYVMFNDIIKIGLINKETNVLLNYKILSNQIQDRKNEIDESLRISANVNYHKQMILALAKAGEPQKIIEYLQAEKVQHHLHPSDRFCENETVNNILCIYQKKAKDENIKTDFSAACGKDLEIAPQDLVTILSNVVENSLHGAIESEKSEKFIELKITYKLDKIVIKCKNSCNKNLRFNDQIPFNIRGIGIQSITKTIEKYGGQYKFSANKGIFSCVIII